VLPLDVYLEHEHEVFQKTLGGVTEDFAATVGAKLLKKDGKSKVVVNFHGVCLAFSCSIVRHGTNSDL
jgi:hypothetical protein